MKLLLDENLPLKLKEDFMEFEVSTVRDQGWRGKKNGELLQLMIENGFDVLLTFDKNLQYQQNFDNYPISVIVLVARINQYEVLKNMVPQVINLLSSVRLSFGVSPVYASPQEIE